MLMILMRLGSIAALVGASLTLNASFRLESRIANWISLPLLAWGQIVLASMTLSELHVIGLEGTFLWHLAFFLLCLAIWKVRGSPNLIESFYAPLTDIVDFGRNNPLLSGFLVLLTGIMVFTFFNSFTPGDADAYHVPRAHYWIQNGTARHFYNYNYRQTQYPPNASFIYMWQSLVTGSYRFLHLAQWIAAWMTGLTCLGIARILGFPPKSAVFAGCLYLSLPGVIIQASTPLNDLLVAYAGSSFLFFALTSLTGWFPGEDLPRSTTSAYAGLAFGLLFGTKVTAFLIVPLLLALAVFCFLLGGPETRRRLWGLILASILGFLLLASYNYILNTMRYGNPVASEDSIDVEMTDISDEPPPWTDDLARSTARNLVRLSYQVMDWDLFEKLPGINRLFHYNLAFYLRMDNLLGIGLETGSSFDLRKLGRRSIDPGTVGFGPVGYAFLLGSPIAGMIALLRRPRDQRTRLGILLLLLAWGFLISQSALLPWFSSRVRYLSLPLALILAAVAPPLYRTTQLSRTLVLALMLIGGWSGIEAAKATDDFAANDRKLSSNQIEILKSALPTEAHVGVAGYVEFHHILKEFPAYGFNPVRSEKIERSLQSGELDAALVRDPEGVFREQRLPLEHDQFLLVRSPRSLILANLDSYSVHIEEVDGSVALRIHESLLIKRTGPDQVLIVLPAVDPVTSGQSLDFIVDFPVAAPEKSALDINCEGIDLPYSIHGSSIKSVLDTSVLPVEASYLSCELQISDYEFGSQVPSGSIAIMLRSIQ